VKNPFLVTLQIILRRRYKIRGFLLGYLMNFESRTDSTRFQEKIQASNISNLLTNR
jgi:hypothetical protein